jgi:hypothetical protein
MNVIIFCDRTRKALFFNRLQEVLDEFLKSGGLSAVFSKKSDSPR